MAKFKVGTTVRENGKRKLYDIVRAYMDRNGIQNYELSGRNGSFDIEEEKLEKFFSPVTVGKDVGVFFGENSNSRACNSTNPVVANAMRARNALPEGYERIPGAISYLKRGTIVGFKGEAYKVKDASNPDRIEIQKVKDGLVLRVSDLDLDFPLRKKSANARASGGVARNAKYKDFGQDVKVEIDDDGSCFFQISLNGLVSPYGNNWNECKPKAMVVIKTLERKAEQLKQAVAWVEKNAK